MNLFTPKSGKANIAQLKQWVTQHARLPESAVVMVTELHCTEPGCPPLETVVAILDAPGSQRQFKLHKAAADVSEEDILALLA